ncbi:DMP19 family protein [Asticcacaulis solisilvae]|uniref:DMP19 family protein n=1 Tax=Asticcacaulis solisilvae TaxID=1217274 RepID=UPI003FD72A02
MQTLDMSWDNSPAFWASFGNLAPAAQVLVPAHFCDAEICNGGFYQLFFNSTGIFAKSGQQAFIVLGMPETAALIEKALLWFSQEELPVREVRIEKLTSHRAAIELRIPDAQREDWDPFAALDDLYYEVADRENGGFVAAADRFAEG